MWLMFCSLIVPDDMFEPARTTSVRIYEKDNRVCWSHIMHYMSNSLFDIYCSYNSAKEIWVALKKKYSMKDASPWIKKHCFENPCWGIVNVSMMMHSMGTKTHVGVYVHVQDIRRGSGLLHVSTPYPSAITLLKQGQC